MHVYGDFLTTKEFTHTSTVLKDTLPSIFASKCFNDLGFTFEKEVQATEIGHLFEHIILEYLCLSKIDSGYKEALYIGKTRWNWIKEPTGLFHITLNVPQEEKKLLYVSLSKGIVLLRKIMLSHSHYSSKKTGIYPQTLLPFFPMGKQME